MRARGVGRLGWPVLLNEGPVGLRPLSGKEKLLVRSGKLTKLQAGGFATRAAAQAACDKLKAAGRACLVTR